MQGLALQTYLLHLQPAQQLLRSGRRCWLLLRLLLHRRRSRRCLRGRRRGAAGLGLALRRRIPAASPLWLLLWLASGRRLLLLLLLPPGWRLVRLEAPPLLLLPRRCRLGRWLGCCRGRCGSGCAAPAAEACKFGVEMAERWCLVGVRRICSGASKVRQREWGSATGPGPCKPAGCSRTLPQQHIAPVARSTSVPPYFCCVSQAAAGGPGCGSRQLRTGSCRVELLAAGQPGAQGPPGPTAPTAAHLPPAAPRAPPAPPGSWAPAGARPRAPSRRSAAPWCPGTAAGPGVGGQHVGWGMWDRTAAAQANCSKATRMLRLCGTEPPPACNAQRPPQRPTSRRTCSSE